MSLKAELETWAAALKAYDEEDFDKSLDLFSQIAESSKILTNMGLIYATLGEHELATEQFNAATGLDVYLAVAYFQCGVSNFLLGRYEFSLKDFDEALLYLRGNQAINYEQLGLKFKLYSAEVMFNRGLSMIYLGNVDEGMRELQEARKEKATDEHNVIDDAITDRGEGYTVFSIPVGVLYRPPENKIKNAKAKDYLGKAKLVAASDASDAYTTFTGVTRLRGGITPGGQKIERPNSDPVVSTNLPVRKPSVSIPPKEGGLQRGGTMRSNTVTGATASPTLQRSPSAVSPGGGGMGGVTRSNTMLNRGPGGGMGGPAGAKRANTPPGQDAAPTPPSKGARLTEMYDDLLDGYSNEPAPPLPTVPEQAKRIEAWAARTPPVRQMSIAGRAQSVYSGTQSTGSMRRRGTQRRNMYGGSNRGPSSRAQSTYDEEEEGYVSGEDYDGGWELQKIRVKIHYADDIRGMALDPTTPYDDFIDKVCRKFDRAFDGLIIRFKDEDGHQISMRDESDYELAIETARESAKGRPEGKLEVWCADR